ncbi:MAG: hypothetical protein Q4D19_09535, partial [Lautropia sp.]|nr:hypothetical protein [Lautropia sp.]
FYLLGKEPVEEPAAIDLEAALDEGGEGTTEEGTAAPAATRSVPATVKATAPAAKAPAGVKAPAARPTPAPKAARPRPASDVAPVATPPDKTPADRRESPAREETP